MFGVDKKCHCVKLLIYQTTHLNYPHLFITAMGKFVNLTHFMIINYCTPLTKIVFISLNMRKPKTFLSKVKPKKVFYALFFSILFPTNFPPKALLIVTNQRSLYSHLEVSPFFLFVFTSFWSLLFNFSLQCGCCHMHVSVNRFFIFTCSQ